LAHYFDQVTGLDFSARFIQQAVFLAQGHRIRYQLPTEGELSEEKICSLEDFALDQLASKVEFFQADACNLKAHFSGYDLILAANLIDLLHHPIDCLLLIHHRINMGRILLRSTPYTWLEEHPAGDVWLGGFKQA